jgi:hypothetical protein
MNSHDKTDSYITLHNCCNLHTVCSLHYFLKKTGTLLRDEQMHPSCIGRLPISAVESHGTWWCSSHKFCFILVKIMEINVGWETGYTLPRITAVSHNSSMQILDSVFIQVTTGSLHIVSYSSLFTMTSYRSQAETA